MHRSYKELRQTNTQSNTPRIPLDKKQMLKGKSFINNEDIKIEVTVRELKSKYIIHFQNINIGSSVLKQVSTNTI